MWSCGAADSALYLSWENCIFNIHLQYSLLVEKRAFDSDVWTKLISLGVYSQVHYSAMHSLWVYLLQGAILHCRTWSIAFIKLRIERDDVTRHDHLSGWAVLHWTRLIWSQASPWIIVNNWLYMTLDSSSFWSATFSRTLCLKEGSNLFNSIILKIGTTIPVRCKVKATVKFSNHFNINSVYPLRTSSCYLP